MSVTWSWWYVRYLVISVRFACNSNLASLAHHRYMRVDDEEAVAASTISCTGDQVFPRPAQRYRTDPSLNKA